MATSLLQLPLIYMCALFASLGPYWCPQLNPSFDRYMGVLCVFGMHLYVVESLGVFIAAVIPNFILGLIVFCSALSQVGSGRLNPCMRLLIKFLIYVFKSFAIWLPRPQADRFTF